MVEVGTGGVAERGEIGSGAVDSGKVGEVGAEEEVGIGAIDGDTCVLCPSSGGSLGAEHLEAQGRITKITHH